jgi:hypothetical protein
LVAPGCAAGIYIRDIATHSFSLTNSPAEPLARFETGKINDGTPLVLCHPLEGAKPAFHVPSSHALDRGEIVLTLVEKNSNGSSYSKRQEKTKLQQYELRPLSTEELCLVNLATLREGVNHRRWPREVVEQFLAVQV